MAAGNSNYTRGSMEVDAQSGTFSGFMGGTKYGGAILAIVVLIPTLLFGVGMGWVSTTVVSVLLGFVMGAAMKFKGGWYVAVVVLTPILTFLLSLLA